MKQIESLSIIGCGHIGTAISAALIRDSEKSGLKKLTLTTRSEASLNKLKDKFLDSKIVEFTTDNKSLIQGSDTVLLAVEPSIVLGLLEELESHLKDKFVISIIAGFALEKLQLYARDAALLMTSTLVSYTDAPIAYALSPGAELRYLDSFLKVFKLVGDMILIKPKDLAASGSVLGCTTLFTLVYIDAVIKGGISRGLTAEQSRRMILGVLKGTVAMLEQSGQPSDTIITSLCTPGGTTIDGLLALEEGNFRHVVAKLVQVSSDKANKLSH